MVRAGQGLSDVLALEKHFFPVVYFRTFHEIAGLDGDAPRFLAGTLAGCPERVPTRSLRRSGTGLDREKGENDENDGHG
jgi:hypothetical protein